jgi:hypothetical protein
VAPVGRQIGQGRRTKARPPCAGCGRVALPGPPAQFPHEIKEIEVDRRAALGTVRAAEGRLDGMQLGQQASAGRSDAPRPRH